MTVVDCGSNLIEVDKLAVEASRQASIPSHTLPDTQPDKLLAVPSLQ